MQTTPIVYRNKNKQKANNNNNSNSRTRWSSRCRRWQSLACRPWRPMQLRNRVKILSWNILIVSSAIGRYRTVNRYKPAMMVGNFVVSAAWKNIFSLCRYISLYYFYRKRVQSAMKLSTSSTATSKMGFGFAQ